MALPLCYRSLMPSLHRNPWLEHHVICYPDALPITQHLEGIAHALQTHQVIIVAGATGSGKTTQLPKIALQLGRGTYGRIGHTQPRRVAARSVAARIAEELTVNLGAEVGFQVRFNDHVSPNSYIKLMTDGILLAELKRDRLLKQYDTIIIDEAHERSLNIDFLLGYLKQLLPKRRDLKVIITSATLDHQRFAEHFQDAPIIEVEGRTFPVDIRYRPIEGRAEGGDSDINQAIYRAVTELWRDDPRGDILVFLSGEKAIRECLIFLKHQTITNTELLPLFGRLSHAEQQAIFNPKGSRRIILSTNIAETSLTVPGIKYVIDTGLARIKRYSYRTKIQRLPIEAIAKANANQRSGRCGRTSPGICIRLYSFDDFMLRAEYTEAEILRSNLAAVMLQMIDLNLGRMEHFAFLDPPDGRFIRDGEKCLLELNAITVAKQLTPIGRQLLVFPLDPRLGRILVEANARNVLPQAIIIVAALSIQDVRERPFDKAQAADNAHAPFLDAKSDFVTLLIIWQQLHEQQQHLSTKQFRAYCRSHYCSLVRLNDWQELVSQLTALCHNAWPHAPINNVLTPWDLNDEVRYEALHKALLTGFISQILQKIDKKDYLGTRNRKLHLFPGSRVCKKAPNWLMCAEMVETTKLYAQQVATIEPEWVLEVAGHLIKKTHSDPQYDSKRGEVFAFEKVLLLGLTLIHQRRVAFALIDPIKAHQVFIREALAEHRYENRFPYNTHNQALFAKITDVEQRTRDCLETLPIDELVLFFTQYVPDTINDTRSFDTWYKNASALNPQLLCLDDVWLQTILSRHRLDDYPSSWLYNDSPLPIQYQFSPGSMEDGVTLSVPALLWRQLPKERLAWLVPGLLEAKITSLFKHLAKAYRRSLPSDIATQWRWREYLTFAMGDLYSALSASIEQVTGLHIPNSAWLEAESQLPEHLRFNVKLWHGKQLLINSRDFALLEQALVEQTPLSAPTEPLQILSQLTPLATHTMAKQGDIAIPVYLAWQKVADGVVQAAVDNENSARRVHQGGVLQWLQLALKERLTGIHKQLFIPMIQVVLSKGTAQGRIKINSNTHVGLFFAQHAAYLGDHEAAWQDFCQALLMENFAEDWWLIRDKLSFDAMFARHQHDLNENARILSKDYQRLIEQLLNVELALTKNSQQHFDDASQTLLRDINAQIQALLYPGFFAKTPYPWRERLSVYLHGVVLRLTACFEKLAQQTLLQREINTLWQQYQTLAVNESSLEYRFMLEEYRLSLFAHSLKTLKPVSAKRLNDLYEKLRK